MGDLGDRASDRGFDLLMFSRRGGGCLRRPMKKCVDLVGGGGGRRFEFTYSSMYRNRKACKVLNVNEEYTQKSLYVRSESEFRM